MFNMRNKSPRALCIVAILALAFTALAWIGCSNERATAPTSEASAVAAHFDRFPADVANVMAVQNRHTARLMKMEGVVGTATTRLDDGRVGILVCTERPGLSGIPGTIDGVPTKVLVTGKVTAFVKPGTSTFDFQAWAPRPVPIGVSIGNYLECASGTYGCCVEKGGSMYVLSNNHVMARENQASLGEKIGQPGLYDGDPICNGTWADTICSLSDFVPIDFSGGSNYVDAAISISSAAFIACATPSGFYGLPNSTTITAQLNMPIQKVGRTTGLTTGTVIGVNATVTVGYTTGTATFVGQILTSSKFSKAGDSGSLVVTNDANANPVGLLFAGNRQGYTWLNPIDNVLQAFNVTICGK